MALIGQIRKNSWLMIVVIGFALAAFIIMDMTSSRGMSGGAEMTVGEVDGKKIPWQEFQQTESVLYNNSTAEVFGRRNFLWNYFVEDAIVSNQAEKLGLSVTDSEMAELQFGNKLSPIIERNFRNQQTGQIDRATLNQYRQQIESGNPTPELASYWEVQGKEVKKDRLQSKLTNMVKKAIYTPTWMAEQAQKDMNSSLTFSYVKVPFTEIEDSEVSITDADYESYLDNNQAAFKIDEEIRTVDFLKYDVLASQLDSQNLREAMVELVPLFRDAENDSTFVENNYGSIDVVYLKKAELSALIADTLFEMATGSVYGPYIEDGNYKAVKLLDKKVIADSVRARHILLRVDPATATQASVIAAQSKIDSIINLIDTGAATFDSLAIKLSEDLGSGAKGGDLGFTQPGGMVKPFNDMIFFQGKPGELNKVYTQYGIHLVEITNEKFITNEESVQVAYLAEPIVPSEDTQNECYDQILDVVANAKSSADLTTAAEGNPNMSIDVAEGLTKNGYFFGSMGAGGTSRDIVRWAFDPSVESGNVASEVFTYEDPVLYYNSTYVVPALKSISGAGKAKVEDVRNTIKLAVMNEKKGELLASKITNKDLAALATQYNTTVDTVQNVNFNMSFLQALGQEPEVLAHLDAMDANEVAGPIVGNNGVYLVKVISKSQASLPSDISTLRNNVAQPIRQAADLRLIDALKKSAKITDNRFTYY